MGSVCGLLAIFSFTVIRLSPPPKMDEIPQLDPPVFPERYSALKT